MGIFFLFLKLVFNFYNFCFLLFLVLGKLYWNFVLVGFLGDCSEYVSFYWGDYSGIFIKDCGFFRGMVIFGGFS